MITDQEIQNLTQLINRERGPNSGLEEIFLIVINGGVHPRIPLKVFKWLAFWKGYNASNHTPHEALSTINDQKFTINSLNDRINHLEQQNTALQNELSSKSLDLNEMIASLEVDKSKLSEKVQEFEIRHDQLYQAILNLESMKKELADEIQSSEYTLTEKNDEIAELKTSISALEREKESKTDEYDDTREESDGLREEINELKHTKINMEKDIEKLKNQLSDGNDDNTSDNLNGNKFAMSMPSFLQP